MFAFSSSLFSFLRRAVPAAMMLALAFNVFAQGTLYRYVDADGRVVYTDRPPPPSARESQIKRAGGNFVETDKISASTRQAMERFPVTLYAFSCGVLCEDAEALLQKRGIPYTFVNTQTDAGIEKLKALTGGLQVPVLQVGKDVSKGFNDAAWEQMLDRGGYAKDAGVRTAVKHTTAPPPSATPEPARQGFDSAPPPSASDVPVI
ncbi:MAG: glutaredoxin family protein [Proteobacteria bacterium]|nr:glutaredoxin family protein [Pseudomonadota bacterium]MCL2308582.1 glutaredoxin family protein [Pseudomonadota bacterium]